MNLRFYLLYHRTLLRIEKFFKGIFFNSQEKIRKITIAQLHGKVLETQQKVQIAKEEGCNHRKGGYSLSGPGDDVQYAVIKHKYPWGDIHVSCMRCGKKWKPGDSDYQEALKFPTRNTMSTSVQFKCDVNMARELTKHS